MSTSIQFKLTQQINKLQIVANRYETLARLGCKKYIIDLLELENILDSLKASLARIEAGTQDDYDFDVESVPAPVEEPKETPMQRRERLAAAARWAEENWVHDLGDEHLELIADVSGDTCQKVCDNLYNTGSYRQREIAYGICFAIQTCRVSGEVVQFMTADKTREVIADAISDFKSIRVSGNMPEWLNRYFWQPESRKLSNT